MPKKMPHSSARPMKIIFTGGESHVTDGCFLPVVLKLAGVDVEDAVVPEDLLVDQFPGDTDCSDRLAVA